MKEEGVVKKKEEEERTSTALDGFFMKTAEP
jgi:hypothetical protein